MSDLRIHAALASAVSALVLVTAADAAAPAPANDQRGGAQAVNVPSATAGTTVGTTDEPGACAGLRGSAWYRFSVPVSGRVAISLRASGNLDATVDVLRLRRSQTDPITCESSDDNGSAQIRLDALANVTYLVRVGQRANSVPGTFRLRLTPSQSEARPPGVRLRRTGQSGIVNRIFNPSDAFWVRLRAGVTYRFNLASETCIGFALYGPNIQEFFSPRRSAGCGGYFTFTPGPDQGGVYSLRIAAGFGNATQRYHVQVAAAGRDDTTPGVFIRNHAVRRGTLHGGRIDGVDLYRFDVTRRSSLDLDLESTSERFSLRLLNDR